MLRFFLDTLYYPGGGVGGGGDGLWLSDIMQIPVKILLNRNAQLELSLAKNQANFNKDNQSSTKSNKVYKALWISDILIRLTKMRSKWVYLSLPLC